MTLDQLSENVKKAIERHDGWVEVAEATAAQVVEGTKRAKPIVPQSTCDICERESDASLNECPICGSYKEPSQ